MAVENDALSFVNEKGREVMPAGPYGDYLSEIEGADEDGRFFAYAILQCGVAIYCHRFGELVSFQCQSISCLGIWLFSIDWASLHIYLSLLEGI